MERAELAVVSRHELETWRVGKGEAVQFIGECGRGKTTRLLSIQRRFADSSYVYLPEDRPCPPIPSGCPLLIDEAQRMPRRARRIVFSFRLPLVLATHNDLGAALRSYGYVVKTFWIGDQNSAEFIVTLLNRRIEASRLRSGPVPVVSMADARKLVDRFGSDVRSIEHFLYERVQASVMRNGELRFID